MKFAFLVMNELRAIKKTIEKLNHFIVDYYNADVFILCQNTFEDDLNNLNLFKNVVYAELYDKPSPEKYFDNDFLKILPNNDAWNKYSNLQIFINYHKMSKIIINYLDKYDYYIILRTDIDILFPFPNKELFEQIPHSLFTFDANYCKSWGGLGISVFVHKQFIIDILTCYYNEIIKADNKSKFLRYNQEKFFNYCLNQRNMKLNYIKNLNFYYTAEKINDYTTWSKPQLDSSRNLIIKYQKQVDEAFNNLNLWNIDKKWKYENNLIFL